MNLTVNDNSGIALGISEDNIGLRSGDTINIGTSDYEDLTNKPSINEVELVGDLDSEDLGLADAEHTHVKADVTDFAHDHVKADITDFAHNHTKSEITDFSHTHTKSEISDFPTLANVATSGNYNDLTNKPTIPEEQIFRVVLTEDEDEEITASETFSDICDAYDEGKYIAVNFVDMDGYGSDLVLIEVAEDDGYINMRDMINPAGYWGFVLYDDESVERNYLQATTGDLNNTSMFVRGNRAIWEGTCTTGASTSAKTVSLGGFLSTDQDVGVMVVVTFDNTNTATPSGLTLNVQNRGAKPIKRLVAGQLADLDSASDLTGTMPFIYDGTNWVTWYDTSGSGTDEKVLQQYQAESGYTYWRPLLIGKSSSGTEGFTPSSTTDQAYVFKTLEVQPSSGMIRMGGASMYKGSYETKVSPDTLTADRTVTIPDKSGTMALTDDIPVDTGDLTNNAGFITLADLPIYNGGVG